LANGIYQREDPIFRCIYTIIIAYLNLNCISSEKEGGIIYNVEEEEIIIFAVIHGKRMPDLIKKRIDSI